MPADYEVLRRKYAEWCTLPAAQRPLDEKTQKAWADKNHVSREQCSRWKKREDHQELRDEATRNFFSPDDVDAILNALRTKAMDGNVQAGKICLQMAGYLDDQRKSADDVDGSALKAKSTAELEALLSAIPLENA